MIVSKSMYVWSQSSTIYLSNLVSLINFRTHWLASSNNSLGVDQLYNGVSVKQLKSSVTCKPHTGSKLSTFETEGILPQCISTSGLFFDISNGYVYHAASCL